MDAKEDYTRYRFAFICSANEYRIKEKEDEHSIKSAWISIDEVDKLDLRSSIVSELVNRYKETKSVISLENVRSI